MREQIHVDIPKEWNENMRHGRCWCGKPKSEFDKNQKFYCTTEHANEYSKRITYWSHFRDEVLAEQGEKCVECGHDEKSFKKEQKQLEKLTYLNEAKNHPEAINEGRAVLIKELQEQFEKIMDDAYVYDHMPYQIREKNSMPTGYEIFTRKYFMLEVDHIKAVALGGDMWNKKNTQVLCSPCHKKKTKQDMKEIKLMRKEDQLKENNQTKLSENAE